MNPPDDAEASFLKPWQVQELRSLAKFVAVCLSSSGVLVTLALPRSKFLVALPCNTRDLHLSCRTSHNMSTATPFMVTRL